MIDPNSPTWRRVKRFIEEQRQQAVRRLIADQNSEQQRGVIQLLDSLEALNDKPPEINTPTVKY